MSAFRPFLPLHQDWHVCKRGDRFAALQPISMGLAGLYGSTAAGAARGLALRMDHGSQYLSDHFTNQIKFWGIQPSYAFVAEPQTNGVAERFNRTLKEETDHARRHCDYHALQRIGLRDSAMPAGSARWHGGQVPRPGSADRYLFDGDIEPRGCAARDGIPLQPQPAQRRDIACQMRVNPRWLAANLRSRVPHAAADSVGECLLSISRSGGLACSLNDFVHAYPLLGKGTPKALAATDDTSRRETDFAIAATLQHEVAGSRRPPPGPGPWRSGRPGYR